MAIYLAHQGIRISIREERFLGSDKVEASFLATIINYQLGILMCYRVMQALFKDLKRVNEGEKAF